MKKILIFLGKDLALKNEEWIEKYKQDEANDYLPYGYNWAENNEYKIDYFNITNFENQIMLKNKYLLFIYIYVIKLPFKLLTYDFVWSHYDRDGIIISKIRKIMNLKIKQISCFVWLLDDLREEKWSEKKIKNMSKILNNIDRIIFHAKTEEELFKKIFKLPESKLKLVHFGINFDQYSKLKHSIQPSLNLKNFILSVGQDRHRDIKMLQKIALRFPEKIFILATGNKNLKKIETNNLKVLSASLPEIRWLYSNCEFVLIPLLYNEHVSGCTTILEAACFEKVVITMKTPGIEDYILDKKTSFLFEPNDYNGVIQIIEKINSKEIELYNIGKNARNYISSKNFSTKQWAKCHLEITKEIVGNQQL